MLIWLATGLLSLLVVMTNAKPVAKVSLPHAKKEARQLKKTGASHGRVIYNLDCSEFFINTFGPVSPETIDKFVDAHAAVGVTDLFINLNAQKTDYRSEVWESYWDGYDPSKGVDQPFFAGMDAKTRATESVWYINTYRLYKQGCDYGKRMIDRARKDGISPWISIRMNDAHFPDKPNHPIHSAMWKSHPEWRLSNGGLDYEQPEVRERYLKLIREICTRYDVDGLELDFLRFWLYFRPGREQIGAGLMESFIKDCRATTQAAAKRLGHPVQLAVRVPTTPWIARMHGLDAVAWAKAGLVDMIIASPFWASMCTDIPIETWKGQLIGTKTLVAFSQEEGIDSGAGRRSATSEEMRGLLVSGLERGADAVYFFNQFTTPYHWPRKEYDQLLKDAGSYADLCAAPRRHALTITHPWAIGEPIKDKYLPYTGKNGAFRIHIGPKPTAKQHARVEIVTANGDLQPEVTVNGIPCPWSKVEANRQVYDVPEGALVDGYNLVELTAVEDFTLSWLEISIH